MKKMLFWLLFLSFWWPPGQNFVVGAAEPSWLQFCNSVNAQSKADLKKAVAEWKNCNLPKNEFFARFNERAGTNIKTDADFGRYLDSPDREMIVCNWKNKDEVAIDHVVRGKPVHFGESWRPCHEGEFVLVDKAKKNSAGGAVVLSGWCLNTVKDKRVLPPPPPPASKPARAAREFRPRKQEPKPEMVAPVKKVEWSVNFLGCNQNDTIIMTPRYSSFEMGVWSHSSGVNMGFGTSTGAFTYQSSNCPR